MLRCALLAILQASLLRTTWAVPAVETDNRSTSADNGACEQIKGAISSASGIFFPGSKGYERGILHWSPTNSQKAACSVEPADTKDLGKIIQIIASKKAKFGVKSGGHEPDHGASSTTGVQIALSRFNEVSYDKKAGTATVGTGLVWDDVYAVLDPLGVHVAGARVTGIGVGGYTLGGGFSWFANQVGLCIDTVTAFELVKPDGSSGWVTESSDSDLFFALKGGLNNFGIVTRITLRTFPGGQVWGGLIQYTSGFDKVMDAIEKFITTVKDPKASILTTFNYILGNLGIAQQLFYDGPNPPPGIFDDFFDSSAQTIISDTKTRSLYDFIRSTEANATLGSRAIFNSVPVKKITREMLTAVANETQSYGQAGSANSAVFTAYTIEPHLGNIFRFTHSPSAWPPSRDFADFPIFMHHAWSLESSDKIFQGNIKQSAAHLREVAKAEGQKGIDQTNPYPNYAIDDEGAKRVYGSNYGRLVEIKRRVDPQDVMGLTGGLKIKA